jgi:hypothetical protein
MSFKLADLDFMEARDTQAPHQLGYLGLSESELRAALIPVQIRATSTYVLKYKSNGLLSLFLLLDYIIFSL